jgi:hypothetical protein
MILLNNQLNILELLLGETDFLLSGETSLDLLGGDI